MPIRVKDRHRGRVKSENLRRLWLSEIPRFKGFPANFDAAGRFVPKFRQHRTLSLPRFGHLQGEGKWPLENRPRLQERSWIFSFTPLLSFHDHHSKIIRGRFTLPADRFVHSLLHCGFICFTEKAAKSILDGAPESPDEVHELVGKRSINRPLF